jgi:hypothetical protein
MAVKQSKSKPKSRAEKTEEKPAAAEIKPEVKLPKWRADGESEEGSLDPQEEKILDWILKGVVAFILGWLALSILMVIGGYFGIWK